MQSLTGCPTVETRTRPNSAHNRPTAVIGAKFTFEIASDVDSAVGGFFSCSACDTDHKCGVPAPGDYL